MTSWGFCLTGGNLRAAVKAEQCVAVIDDLARAYETPGPVPLRGFGTQTPSPGPLV